MTKLNRRKFFRQTSAGAISMGVLTVMPVIAAKAQSAEAVSVDSGNAALNEPMFVHIKNGSTGEISLMVGTREIIINDQEVVKRLVRAAR